MDEISVEQWRALAIKKPKYRNRKTTVGGIVFDSKGEADRWGELLTLAQAGAISDLERQRTFDLHGQDGSRIGGYVADFCYQQDGRLVVEDFKGVRTRLYRWKAKLLKAEYGISIVEVGRRRRQLPFQKSRRRA